MGVSTRKAAVGEAIRLRWDSPEQADYLVQPACSTSGGGQHYCATHPNADVRNNFMFNHHLDEPGEHVEVWLCEEHGPEQP